MLGVLRKAKNMNGKTTRKLFSRKRTRNFWGPRTYMTVRIPLTAIPEALPNEGDEGLGDYVFGGLYERFDGERVYLTRFGKVSGGYPQKEQKRKVFFPSKIEDDWYTWYEAYTNVYPKKEWYEYKRQIFESSEPGAAKRPTPIEVYDLPEPLVRRLVDREYWHERYTHRFDYPEGYPLAYLGVAANYSKTQYSFVRGNYFYLTYSVKHMYRERAHEFCRALTRAFRRAKKAGIVLRIVGE